MLTPNTRRLLAVITVVALGLGLLSALQPYIGGLLGAPMLYVIWAPLQRRLARRMPAPIAAAVIIVLTLVLVVLPGTLLLTSLLDQAQGAVQGALRSPVLQRLGDIEIGGFSVGPAIVSAGQSLLNWLGGNALSLLGAATRMVLNLVFAMFGLYFLLIHPGKAWNAVEPYIPFTPERAARLRQGFVDVTLSTVVGTGVIALVQGTMVGGAFAVLGLPDPLFWGSVTAVLSILPLVGSGLIWAPAAVGLFMVDSPGRAIAMIIWGVVVVGNIDNIIRPYIYNRFARIHPMITLVGAIIGVEQMGFVGLIIGPLGISYFFELLRMYSEEYVTSSWPVHPAAAASGAASAGGAAPPAEASGVIREAGSSGGPQASPQGPSSSDPESPAG